MLKKTVVIALACGVFVTLFGVFLWSVEYFMSFDANSYLNGFLGEGWHTNIEILVVVCLVLFGSASFLFWLVFSVFLTRYSEHVSEEYVYNILKKQSPSGTPDWTLDEIVKACPKQIRFMQVHEALRGLERRRLVFSTRRRKKIRRTGSTNTMFDLSLIEHAYIVCDKKVQ